MRRQFVARRACTVPASTLHREARRAAFVGRRGAAVVQADGPVVQRAGDAGAEHDALRQRAALVRAAVEQREDLVLALRNTATSTPRGARHAARAQHRDVVDAADRRPVVHASVASHGRSACTQVGLLRPVRRVGHRRRTGARRPRPAPTRTTGRARRRARTAAAPTAPCGPAASSRMLLLHVVEADAARCSAPCAPGTSLPRGRAAGRRRVYSSTSSAVFTLTRNCATSVLMPPLPPT